MHIFPEELIEKIRAEIDPVQLLRMIDYRTETIQIIGQTIKAFCPIHREPIFRTLLVDSHSRTYRCSNKQCTGHDGGDMIDLYARSRNIGYEEALPELASAFGVEVDLSVAQEYMRRAQEIADNYFDMGTLADAEEQYDRILKFQPSSIDALRGLVRVYNAKGNEEKAMEATLRLATALAATDANEEAAGLLQTYIQKNQADTPTRLLYIECLKKTGNDEWVAGEYINLADYLTEQGEIEQALEIYRRIEAMQLESTDVAMHIVQILTTAGRRDEAVGEMIKRADVLATAGDFTRAIVCLQQALEIDASRDDLRVRLAQIVGQHQMAGEPLNDCCREIRTMLTARSHGPAAQALDHLMAAFPHHVALTELKGDLEEARGHEEAALDLRLECIDLYEKRKELEQALHVLEKALRSRQDNVALLSRHAGLLRELGRKEEAVACYLTIVSLFESADEFDHAAAVYQTIIDLEPDAIEHRVRQFELYLRLGLEPIVAKTALALAEAYEIRGDSEQASQILERALSVAPESADLLTRHGELLEKLGRRGEAAEQFLAVSKILINQQLYDRARHRLERALSCLPEHMEARELRADVLVQQDMTLQAMGEYTDLAQAYLAASEPENVIRVSKKILSIQPDHLPTLQLLGAAYGQSGDTEKQRAHQMRLVQLYRQTQSFTRASELCEEILSADEDFTPAIEQLVGIAEATHQSGSAIKHLWKLSQVFARAGKREEEQSILDRVLARDQLHRPAWYRNIELMMQWATPRALAEAVKMAIDHFTAASRRGDVVQILDDLRAAPNPKPEILAGLVRLRKLAGDTEGVKEALRAQANLLMKSLRDEEAIDILGELAEMIPDDVAIRRSRIELMIRADQRESAATEYRKLAEMYADRNRLEEAESAYREMLKIAPADAKSRDALITLYIRMDNLARAADAIEDLAAHYIKKGQFAEAASVYERVFEYDPKREEIFRKIIAVKQRAGDLAGALAYYDRLLDFLAEEGRAGVFEQTAQEAIALDPANWAMRRRLADHLVKVGRTGEAEAALLELAGLQIRAESLDAAAKTVDEVLELNKGSVQARAFHAELLARGGDAKTALAEFMSLTGSLSSIRNGRTSEDPAAPFAFGNYEGLTRVKSYSFDHFVVGARNNFAHATALAVSRAPGKNYNPLFLYADVGLGKTHLCHAIANYILDHHPDLKLMYTMTEDFIGGLIDGIQNNTITAFRNRHRLTDILIIDDIQFLSGKERAQEEFFHIFNALFQAGKQIIITSDRPPKDIAHLEKRLRSRFGAGIIVDIQSPDLETRIAILRKELIQRGRNEEVSDEVVLYLAENIQQNIRDLKGALNQVLARRDVSEQEIDIDLVQQAVEHVSSRV